MSTPISMYSASVTVFQRQLDSLHRVLEKGQAFASARKIDDATILGARLALDMLPLTRQVTIASDNAKGCGARLAGVDVPSFPDTESTIADLLERVKKTQSFLATLTPDQFVGSETREVHLKFPNAEFKFDGLSYLQTFALPNFFFHTTMAYAILRHYGVELKKTDFLGA